jgi:hypothetical protein
MGPNTDVGPREGGGGNTLRAGAAFSHSAPASWGEEARNGSKSSGSSHGRIRYRGPAHPRG